ncbi:MAG: ATP-binding protein [Acidimicrobiales bacterium]
MSFDSLPDAVVTLDRALRITSVNAAAERLSGFASGSLVGREIAEALGLQDGDGAPAWAGGWHPSAVLPRTRGIPEQNVSLRRADGARVVAAGTGSYVRGPGGVLQGAVISLRPRGRVSSGIDIVSTVSHELRSPLTSVKGYASLLLSRWDRLSDGQKQMMLRQVEHDADRVTRLINELLDISRLETGRLVLRRQMVSLKGLAAAVVDNVALEWPELEATLCFSPGFPEVYADADKLEQVLTNLVENACKYGSAGELGIEGDAAAGEVSVTVADRGEGIPEADLAKVFTRFFRRSEGRPSGSGLGLWISRGLVEAHGGRLEARSIVGQGCSFVFTLPLADPDESRHEP